MTWESDPRPLAECLRDWAARHGVAWGVSTWLAERTGASQRTIEGWLAGKRPAGAEPVIRRLMTLLDEIDARGSAP